MNGGPLAGMRIVVTREHAGELASRLAGLGADVSHVPLIEACDPDDGGAALRRALSRLAEYDWLLITSPNGARRVVEAVEVGAMDGVRIGCVGSATAKAVAEAGRTVDLIPRVASLDGLLAELPRGKGRVLAARGDLADRRLAGELAALGWDVDDIVAYRTVERDPDDDERTTLAAADVVVVASGSAARALAAAAAAAGDCEVISIGPSTTAAAEQAGLHVASTASEHSIDGLVDAVLARARQRR